MTRRVVCSDANGVSLIAAVEWRDTAWGRGLGLLGHRALPPGRALALIPCRALHTWGMRFRLDALFFARDGRVLRIARDVGPWRMLTGGRAAWGALELQTGWFPWHRLREGDRLVFAPLPP